MYNYSPVTIILLKYIQWPKYLFLSRSSLLQITALEVGTIYCKEIRDKMIFEITATGFRRYW